MNLTMAQWKKIKEIEKSGFIEVTQKELIDLIGCSGGMFLSGKLNEREKIFVNSFYKIGSASKININKY